MKHQYKLDTGLWEVNCNSSKDLKYFMFESDEEAWNKLRLDLPGKYATLYRRDSASIVINNYKETNQSYFSKYKREISDTMYKEGWYWKPVVFGVTDDEYKVD